MISRPVLLLVAAVLLWTPCPASSGAAEAAPPEFANLGKLDGIAGLSDAITSYFIAESREDWFATYSARPDSFQNIFHYEVYAREMTRNHAGGELLKLVVDDVETGPDQYTGARTVRVRIRFYDRFVGEEKGLFGWPVPGSDGIYENIATTVWLRERDEWKCLDCGMRLHLVLSGRMTF